MIETPELLYRESELFSTPTQPLAAERGERGRDVGDVRDVRDIRPVRGWHRSLSEVLRFAVVGGLNTLVDLLILNCLLWLFPTTSALMLLAYNSLAYSVGAANSFLLNKYWTFAQRQRTTRREVFRFALTTLCGIGWSNGMLWIASTLLHPVLLNPTVWANASKVFAIAGTALISYLGMRLWVFARKGQQEN